jgi:hypothetical protein
MLGYQLYTAEFAANSADSADVVSAYSAESESHPKNNHIEFWKFRSVSKK